MHAKQGQNQNVLQDCVIKKIFAEIAFGNGTTSFFNEIEPVKRRNLLICETWYGIQ